MNIAIGILTLALAVYLVARWTIYRMKLGEYIDHRDPAQRRKEWLIKAGSAIPGTVLLWWPFHWWAIPVCMMWYWLAFDACMGIMLGKGINYSGTVWTGRAKTATIPLWVKVALNIIFITLYVNSLTDFLWQTS